MKRTLTISVLLLFLGGCKATFVETYNNGTPYKAMARAVGDADLARGEEGEQDFRFSSGGSPTYGQWVSEELTFENGKQLYIPEGFLHGFVTLEPNSEIIYKCTNFYNKSSEGCVRFNDPDLKISWGKSINNHVISTKDRYAVQLEDFKSPFAL